MNIDGLRTDLNVNPDTGEHWVELRDSNNELAARVRFTPSQPEGTSTEFTVTPEYQAQGLGKTLIVQMLTEMRDEGCSTARLVNVQATDPFVRYGCTIDGTHAIVDLINGTTLEQLTTS